MADKGKQACNRKPFLSDASCSRGSVDIYRFSEIPFCKPIDPKKSDVPPNVVEQTFDMELPPPCNCINIVPGKRGIRSKKIGEAGSGGMSFGCSGDCCKGEYKLDLDIPCPIQRTEKTTIAGKVEFVPQDEPPPPTSYEIFPATSGSSCVMPQPKSVKMDLKLPCPVKIQGDRKSRLSVKYKNNPSPVEMIMAQGNRETCAIDAPQNQNIELGIPCPVPNKTGTLNASIKYGGGFNKAKAVIAKGNNAACTLDISTSPSLELEIPDPFAGSPDNGGINITVSCGNSVIASASARIVSLKPISPMKPDAGKQMELHTASLDLKLKCPVRKKVGDPTIGITIKQAGEVKFRQVKSFLEINSSTCDVFANGASFSFDVSEIGLDTPCPVKEAGEFKVKVKYKVGDTNKSASGIYAVAKNDSSCYIELKNPEINLGDIGGGGGSTSGLTQSLYVDPYIGFGRNNVLELRCYRVSVTNGLVKTISGNRETVVTIQTVPLTTELGS